jgi:hypothetical protein
MQFLHIKKNKFIFKGQISTFRLSNFYSNEMVLQRAPKSAAIWGYGQPGAEVRISYESNQISAIVGGNIFLDLVAL